MGFRDPIGVWHGEIVEGHGRHIAAKELGMTEVPIIRLDDLTDEERRAYALIHNQTTMNSGWDNMLLDIELGDITDIDMSVFGFETDTEEFDMDGLDDESEKTSVIVSINCANYDDYESIKDELQNVANKVGASVAVKMA